MAPPTDYSFEALLVLLRRQRFAAAVSRLLDAFSTSSRWERSQTPPFQLEERPSELGALWRRLQAGTATDGDRAALAGLPRCHAQPEQLVEIVARLEETT